VVAECDSGFWCDPGGTEFTAGERYGRSMSNPEHLPYDGVTEEAAR